MKIALALLFAFAANPLNCYANHIIQNVNDAGLGSHGVDRPLDTFNIDNVGGIIVGPVTITSLVTGEHPVLRFSCTKLTSTPCGIFTDRTKFFSINPFQSKEVRF